MSKSVTAPKSGGMSKNVTVPKSGGMCENSTAPRSDGISSTAAAPKNGDMSNAGGISPGQAHRKAHRRAHRARHFDYGHHRRVKKIVVVEPRRRYRKIWVHRRYGHRYHGYGHHHDDHDAYQWLAFTAITLGVLDYMTVTQQRAHESAQITATSAPIGQSINWNDKGLQGSVTATREGTSSSGRYCREFRQAVTIGGKVQESYGTACRQPDGAWEIMP